MKEPIWLERDALLLLHGTSLARFGGAGGIRDVGLLDSALARPVNLYNYKQANDLADLASSYAFGLIKNHALLDGNKRIAFLACGMFLERNGKVLVAESPDAISALMALADGTITEREFAAWIRENWRSVHRL
jgi:death-on-curing protein